MLNKCVQFEVHWFSRYRGNQYDKHTENKAFKVLNVAVAVGRDFA